MQSDGRLAGARGALHADGGAEIRPHQVVLLRLDGGGDVPHGTEPWPLDLDGEKTSRVSWATLAVLAVLAATATTLAASAASAAAR